MQMVVFSTTVTIARYRTNSSRHHTNDAACNQNNGAININGVTVVRLHMNTYVDNGGTTEQLVYPNLAAGNHM
jgi:hypothetical protein